MLLSIILLYKKELLTKIERFRDISRTVWFASRFAPMRRIFTLGFLSAIQDVSWAIAMIVTNKILTTLPNSTDALSAFSIAFNIEAICFMPGIAFMQSAQVMVGQFFGSKDIKGAERAAWTNTIFGSSFMALLGIPLALFPDFAISLFTKDAAVIEIGRIYLVLMGVTQFFMGVKFILMGSLNGAGDTKIPMYAELIEHWVLRIPPIVIMVLFYNSGTTTVWTIMALSNVIDAIAIFILFKNGYWKRLKLI